MTHPRQSAPPSVRWHDLLAVAALATALLATPASVRAQTDTTAAGDTAATAVHFRLIGVYDEEFGAPLEGADITDHLTGLSVRTTATGTAALFFTDSGGTVITTKKVGYQPRMMAVSKSTRDSTPITATLLKMGHVLPTVITVGNREVWLTKADTIPALIRNGFYARRLTTAAPSTAFITGDKIGGTLLVSNARFWGRPICEGNVYIDGVRVTVPPRTRGSRFLEQGIDQIVNPFDVAGIETYRTGELPAGAPHTDAGPATLDLAGSMASMAMANAAGTMASSGCVTFIWLKW